MPRNNSILGLNPISEALRRGASGTLLYSGQNKRVLSLVQEAKRRGMETRRLSPKESARHKVPQSQPVVLILAESSGSHAPELLSLREFLDRDRAPSSLSIFLDGITDPHNIGAIYRVADQFGAEAVGIPGKRSGGITDTVAKVSSGAVFHVTTVQLDSVADAVRQAKDHGFWIYGADGSGRTPEELTFAGPAILVMGSEGSGMHRLVRERCDDLIAIPTWGTVDSLNVSVATGVLAYELRRRLGAPD